MLNLITVILSFIAAFGILRHINKAFKEIKESEKNS